MGEGELMKWYICDPRKNTGCTKTGCLYYLGGECFSTGNPANAMTGKDGEPVSYQENEYDDVKRYMKETYKSGLALALDDVWR